jgi:putative transposase
MSKPPHRLFPGATYFVSTATWERRELFRVPEVADILVRRILACRDRGAFLLHEFVVMPNHFHLLMTPSETTTLENAIQLIKGGSSHEIHAQRGTRMEIWQIGFHEWSVRDAEDYLTKVAYIRMNPVRARLVERPQDWALGSASGRFSMDPAPEKFSAATSGAKAPQIRSHVRPG